MRKVFLVRLVFIAIICNLCFYSNVFVTVQPEKAELKKSKKEKAIERRDLKIQNLESKIGEEGVRLTGIADEEKLRLNEAGKDFDKDNNPLLKREGRTLKNLKKNLAKLLQEREKDIIKDPAPYLKKRAFFEEIRKDLRAKIAESWKNTGKEPESLRDELEKVNEQIFATMSLYEQVQEKNRDQFLSGKGLLALAEKELQKAAQAFEKGGMNSEEINKKIAALREKDVASLKSRTANQMAFYKQKLLEKYGLKEFPRPTPEEVKRVAEPALQELVK
jgi:hypothetical protein